MSSEDVATTNEGAKENAEEIESEQNVLKEEENAAENFVAEDISEADEISESEVLEISENADTDLVEISIPQEEEEPDFDIKSFPGEPASAEEDNYSEAHPLDELTDQQVIDLVQEVETESRHLDLENNLFESFLRQNDPSLLDGFEEMMNFVLGRSGNSYISTSTTGERRSSYFDKRYKLDSYTSITSIAEGKGPKINLAQKTEMVMRAMEESQASLETFLKKCHITKRNLKAELEEFSIREAEFKEASEIFEYSVVTQGVDKLTQRIPAEKFIRYMEEWLKSAQLQIEKLRLRIATLKVQYKKVSQQLIQRQELGENVHAVDFDQLEIENKHFIERIEQKNIHLVELKKMNGGANLILSTHKKYLQKQQEDCNNLKAEIDEKNNQIEATDKECIAAEEELQAEMEKFENCRKLKNQYTVPDVMEYVRLKGKLHELKKNIKIWIRRRKIQDIALNTCLREMKNLTGRTDVDPSWFDDVQSISESNSEDILL